MKIPHPDLFCLNPAPLPRIFQKTRQAKSNFAEKKSKYLLRRIENQNHDRGEASSNGENQGSPPSRNYRKTLKYFRALCANCWSSLEFFIFVDFGLSFMGTLRFPTEFGLFSRFTLILNCSRGKFQQKNQWNWPSLDGVFEKCGRVEGGQRFCFKYWNFAINFHGLKLFFTAVILLKNFTGGN